MDRKTGEDIWGAEEKIYKRTSSSSARFKQKNKDGD